MKTKKDILKIMAERNPFLYYDEKSVRKILSKHPDDATLEDISKEFTEEMAFNWGIVVGDREIMRERIKTPRFAFWWAIYTGEHKEMEKRFPPEVWHDLWQKHERGEI